MGPLEKTFTVLFMAPPLLAVALVLVVPLVRWRRARAARRAWFLGREQLTPDEWFAHYLPVSPETRAAVTGLLDLLERGLGVPWTSLRPTDTFPGTLRLPPDPWVWWSGNELENFCEAAEEWVERREITVGEDVGASPIELIRFLARAAELPARS